MNKLTYEEIIELEPDAELVRGYRYRVNIVSPGSFTIEVRLEEESTDYPGSWILVGKATGALSPSRKYEHAFTIMVARLCRELWETHLMKLELASVEGVFGP